MNLRPAFAMVERSVKTILLFRRPPSGPPRELSLARWRTAALAVFAAVGSAFPAQSLEWRVIPAGRAAPLTVVNGTAAGWVRQASARTGLTFTNVISVDRYTTNQIYLNGSGVCAGDVDGDGWSDLFLGGLAGGSALYRNRGNWTFEDRTVASGVKAACSGLDVSGAALVDLDGDGDLDLVVNSTGGGTHGLLNDGRGAFTPAFQLNAGRGGTSMALGDLDGDGDLDLYVTNYRPETLRDQPRTNFRIGKTDGKLTVKQVNGRATTEPDLVGRFTYLESGSIVENGEVDAVFRNLGDGRFEPVSFTGGAFLDAQGQPLKEPPYDWGLSVIVRDLTGDGRPDIYVCNDFASPDRFWINEGGFRFRAAPELSLRNTSKFSMGIDVADINRDGHDDLFVLDMMSRDHAVRLTRMDATMDQTPAGAFAERPQFARNTLHLNRGDGTYAEIAQYAGLEATEWAWAPVFVDVDLDGYEDVLVGTGHARDDMHLDYGMRIEAQRKTGRLSVAEELSLRKSTPAVLTPCLAYRNLGNLRFAEMPGGWGFGEVPAVTHGIALADLDNDGDQDLVVNRLNGEAGVYRNDASAARVAVRLKGRAPNSRGVGARVELRGGAVPVQAQEFFAGGRYLSGDDPVRVFAAGTSTGMELVVNWPGGRRSVVKDIQPNHLYEIDEARVPSEAAPALPPRAAPLFTDESGRLGHRHFERPFDDWERQPLLPRKQSQAGPGVGWIDLNGDGRDDLVIGSGRGGRPGLFLGTAGGAFQVVEPEAVERDQLAVAGWAEVAGKGSALISVSPLEDPPGGAGGAVARLDADGRGEVVIDSGVEQAGPLALADVDGDGDLELFVGGRSVPGRYPEASPSRLFERREGRWVVSTAATEALAGVGLVSGAIWTDLDGDRLPELVLACEWGPVRVFRNTRGALREVTTDLGLGSMKGWWNSVAAGDFDEDGRQDLVVGNWGLNSRYRPSADHPVRLYYGELAGQGQVELVEASFDPGLKRWVPERDLRAMSRQFPWLLQRFRTHEDYARAGVDDLFAEPSAKPAVLEATSLASVMLLNRGERFEVRPLPAEAQWAPAYGLSVADFDLDGHTDLFLAQGFFAVCNAISRQDAGRGLLLLGAGDGTFRVTGTESGLAIYGEQRGSAVGDFDEDGRPDLVVTQNAAATRLFRNASPRRGLALRLVGPAGNPSAIGAVVRRVGPRGAEGPAHELHAGSGYGSQDAPVVFLPRTEAAVAVEVRWPGGATRRHDLRDDAPTLRLQQP